MSGGDSALNRPSGGANGALNEMVVESVRVHMMSSQHVVILRDTGHDRYLPIWIGPWEAKAIAMRLQGVTPERPMTHDLFSQTPADCGVSFKRIIVSDLSDDTFRARLMLQIDGREVDLDARPSDAIALAVGAGGSPLLCAAGGGARPAGVRAGVPICATDAVLDRAGVVPEGAEDEKLSVFREFVNSLNVDLPEEPGEGSKPGWLLGDSPLRTGSPSPRAP